MSKPSPKGVLAKHPAGHIRPETQLRSYAMNELITISSRRIGAQEVQTVNARELHAFLEVSTVFATWIRRRIEEYGFVYGRDFLPFLQESSGGRPATEYAITLDMAKELSMVERNDKGKQARQYFIECERRALQAPQAKFSIPKTLSEALRLAADQAETIERQAAQIEQQKPAVEFVERYTEADGSKGFREVCKLLKANEARFRQFLLDARILYRLGGRLMPFAQHLEAGRFTVITGMNGENAYTTAKFTSKGITWVAGEWAKHNLAMGV